VSFGECLTKLAIILTVYGAVQDGMWSTSFGWKAAGTLLALSFLRDASIRWREAARLMPGFGFWFLVTCLLICPANAIIKKLVGYDGWGFSYWGSVSAAGLIAMFFRGWMVVCEGYSRWVVWFLGWDNKRVDAAHRYFQQQRWDWVFGSSQAADDDEWHEEDDEWDDGFDDPPEVTVRVVNGKVVKCPVCAVPLDGNGTCMSCGHRFLPQAISHNRQARLN
jgi:ferredoxin